MESHTTQEVGAHHEHAGRAKRAMLLGQIISTAAPQHPSAPLVEASTAWPGCLSQPRPAVTCGRASEGLHTLTLPLPGDEGPRVC
ncbi:hypothetical protein E2C01_073530 [Portunus trituberculatus]|uniref:Uncharacterized protein n=1 Tax=Portunus trituberculatus TaxID=210409 RepID=A0A5B7IAT0_PORTR|nr:hypothetical protein [Portunus trituberculatus]